MGINATLEKSSWRDLEDKLSSLPSVDLGTFTNFETQNPCSFSDFHRTLFRMITAEINAHVIGFAKSYLAFPFLYIRSEHGKDQGIDIGGWQGGTVGISGSFIVGLCIVMGPAN